ncbi:hypothetical protein Bca52824_075245 [Brassica carinata]|uniref:Uncharacterized protein n=1 Tax=Brassica carinata TaxID=52824 RepID=A0A8X7TXS2_BRACI|nr:hypothetical protein Bca52824_075245 [Brassica carinata]
MKLIFAVINLGKVFRKCRVLSFYFTSKRRDWRLKKQKSVERTEFSWRRRPVHGRPVHGVGDYRFTHGRHLLSRVASTGNP